MNSAVFNQPGWNVGRVYNIAGNLILSETSSREDFLDALRELRQELATLDQVDAAQRAELDTELDGALMEASSPQPSKERVVGRLERLGERLSALGGVMSRALDVAKTVASVAAWATNFF